MRVVKILKKNKKDYRTIYVQNSGWERKKYRSLALILQDFYLSKVKHSVAQGFMPMRNCVTNAREHRGKKFTLTIDLKSFFDYVSADHLIKAGVNPALAEAVMYEGRARQGLSSSPMAANIAASPIDSEILEYIKDKDCVYTRYADDLTFSSDDIGFLKNLRGIVNKIVRRHKFKVNHKKTRIQSASYGRRVITGVAVDDECHPTRANKRKLRALKHNLSKETIPWKIEYFQKMINGLEEFTKCKLPNEEPKKQKLNLQLWHKHIEFAPDKLLKPEFLNRRYYKKIVNRRRDFIEKVGIERCLPFLETKVLDTYHNYQLISVKIGTSTWRQRTNRVYLKMQNPSVEGMFHIEGVHPDCKKVQDGINYRRYGNTTINNPPWFPIILT